jgi:hypothetical protein
LKTSLCSPASQDTQTGGNNKHHHKTKHAIPDLDAEFKVVSGQQSSKKSGVLIADIPW